MGPLIWAQAAVRPSTAALTTYSASSRLPVVTCTSRFWVIGPTLASHGRPGQATGLEERNPGTTSAAVTYVGRPTALE